MLKLLSFKVQTIRFRIIISAGTNYNVNYCLKCLKWAEKLITVKEHSIVSDKFGEILFILKKIKKVQDLTIMDCLTSIHILGFTHSYKLFLLLEASNQAHI